jgi:hypothetical protein
VDGRSDGRGRTRPRGFQTRCLVFLALAVVVGALLYPFVGDIPRNDWNLWRLSRNLAHAPHPPNTQRLAARRRTGLLIGNGNHCDFFAGELRRFDGDRERLRAFYRNSTIANPVDGNRSSLEVAFFKDGTLPEYTAPYGLEQVMSWGGTSAESSRYYVVYVFESYDDDRFCDIRCH